MASSKGHLIKNIFIAGHQKAILVNLSCYPIVGLKLKLNSCLRTLYATCQLVLHVMGSMLEPGGADVSLSKTLDSSILKGMVQYFGKYALLPCQELDENIMIPFSCLY